MIWTIGIIIVTIITIICLLWDDLYYGGLWIVVVKNKDGTLSNSVGMPYREAFGHMFVFGNVEYIYKATGMFQRKVTL